MLVYSHDTFGLGNIRRMLAICEHLHARIPGLSVLILTGSPMLHSFRLVDGIDYVKLPCLRRDGEGSIRVKYLNINLDSTVRLRRKLIHSTVTHFRPDILLVDKKPGGVVGELEETLKTIKTDLPHTAVVLLLRDILDDAAVTIAQWKRQSAYKLLEDYYHKILVAGLPELYDVREEYQFPASLRAKVHFCGYVGRKASPRTRLAILSHDPSLIGQGALLGDRASMVYSQDDRVFMRSLATRGQAGGLSPASGRCLRLLKCGGFDRVFVETVGIGQEAAPFGGEPVDRVILVMSPDYGSRLQLQKIVMLDVADIVVLNKSDLSGAKTAAAEIEQRLALNGRGQKLIQTVARRHRDTGVDELFRVAIS